MHIDLISKKAKVIIIIFYSGYMSPEYAMFGKFSEKSDVFSFGVMVLEIVSGKRNSSSYKSDQVVGLLNYVSIKLQKSVCGCVYMLAPSYYLQK